MNNLRRYAWYILSILTYALKTYKSIQHESIKWVDVRRAAIFFDPVLCVRSTLLFPEMWETAVRRRDNNSRKMFMGLHQISRAHARRER